MFFSLILLNARFLYQINCSLTFGSNFNEFAVKYAARPSFNVIAKPPINGEYSIDTTYVLLSKIGTANKLIELNKYYYHYNWQYEQNLP